jgi:N-acetylglutamate synthase-like GNAT family acetyltransferase
MKVTEPKTSEEFEKYYRLRWEVLRKPWGWERGSELTDDEDKCVHALVCDEKGEAVGVCRLQMNSAQEAQIRFMGVRDDQQGKGVGKLIIAYMEGAARQKKANYIVLQARENALDFYKRCGYAVVEKSHLMWGKIQHYLMRKYLA